MVGLLLISICFKITQSKWIKSNKYPQSGYLLGNLNKIIGLVTTDTATVIPLGILFCISTLSTAQYVLRLDHSTVQMSGEGRQTVRICFQCLEPNFLGKCS